MNNFDDLFEQQPQPEATEKPEPQKEKPKKQWWQIREEKQRKEAYATLDRVFGAFSEGHGDMKAYLDTQSRFPFHSARNAILIGEQCPKYEVIAAFKTVAYSGEGFKYYHFVNAESAEAFDEYIAECKALALYDTGVTAEYGDKLITLSTCEYSRTNGRMVVVAKLLDA